MRNAGDVAVSNLVVAFYDGNPTNGGTLITNLAEHILSAPPQNIFLDTAATNSSQFFYRLKVE